MAVFSRHMQQKRNISNVDMHCPQAKMAMVDAQVWRSFRALREHVCTVANDSNVEYVVEGQLMHQRRVSRRCSFFDLASADQSESTSSDRVEVILKIVEGEISTEDVERVRHRICVGDIVHVRCRMERLATENKDDVEMLLHARDIVTVAAWKDKHPGVPFVPAPTVHTKTKEANASHRSTTPSTDNDQKLHCKFWINTGACQHGDQCEFYHAPKSEMKEARAKWLDERLRLKRERASQDADPHDAHGKISKHQRASVFVQWLVDTFGAEYLASGSGVVDVAGGRGNVSFELWNKRQIPSTLIDPRPMKLSRVQHKHFKKLKLDNAAIEASLVPQKLALFNTTTFFEEPANETLVCDAAVLIGMHPDEATDSIFDVALKCNKPFAVVPCCVFGHSFPDRRMPDGVSKVLSYEDLVEYLAAKSSDVRRAFLPFDGKNLVLYRLPPPPPPPPVAKAS